MRPDGPVSVERRAANPDIARLRQLATLWDDLVPLPFFNRKIGLDALIGLVPGVGDVAGALVASWGLVTAFKFGAPASVMLRMLLNIVIDALVGSIPVLGDIFDIGWRAQHRNVALLEQWLVEPHRARRGSIAVLVGVAVSIAAVVVAALWLALQALQWMIHL